MLHYRWLIFIVFTILLLPFSAFAQTQTRTKRPSEQIQHLPIPNLNDLSYHEARKKLIDAGWQPRKIDPMYREPGSEESGNSPIFLEQGYAELINCAGTGLGYCIFEFKDVYGNYLSVVTVGQEIPEQKSYAIVNNWRLERSPHEQRN